MSLIQISKYRYSPIERRIELNQAKAKHRHCRKTATLELFQASERLSTVLNDFYIGGIQNLVERLNVVCATEDVGKKASLGLWA